MTDSTTTAAVEGLREPEACPFCAGTEIDGVETHEDSWMECCQCGARAYPADGDDSRAAMLAAWNRRASPPAVGEPLSEDAANLKQHLIDRSYDPASGMEINERALFSLIVLPNEAQNICSQEQSQAVVQSVARAMQAAVDAEAAAATAWNRRASPPPVGDVEWAALLRTHRCNADSSMSVGDCVDRGSCECSCGLLLAAAAARAQSPAPPQEGEHALAEIKKHLDRAKIATPVGSRDWSLPERVEIACAAATTEAELERQEGANRALKAAENVIVEADLSGTPDTIRRRLKAAIRALAEES